MEQKDKIIKNNNFDEIIRRYKQSAIDDKSYYTVSRQITKIGHKRYYADIFLSQH